MAVRLFPGLTRRDQTGNPIPGTVDAHGTLWAQASIDGANTTCSAGSTQFGVLSGSCVANDVVGEAVAMHNTCATAVCCVCLCAVVVAFCNGRYAVTRVLSHQQRRGSNSVPLNPLVVAVCDITLTCVDGNCQSDVPAPVPSTGGFAGPTWAPHGPRSWVWRLRLRPRKCVDRCVHVCRVCTALRQT